VRKKKRAVQSFSIKKEIYVRDKFNGLITTKNREGTPRCSEKKNEQPKGPIFSIEEKKRTTQVLKVKLKDWKKFGNWVGSGKKVSRKNEKVSTNFS